MEKCVIFDLDGTLCELRESTTPYAHSWTEQLIYPIYEEMEKEWCPLDVTIIILTWRHYDYHDITVKWLEENNVQYDHLIMCKDGQPEENHIFKKRVLRMLSQMFEIQMMYDDNPEVEKVCRRLKVPFYPCY